MPEDPEHPAVRLHEALAGRGQRAGVAGGEEGVDGLGGELAAEHGVVDALARGRRDDAGGVAGQHHVAAVVPALAAGLSGIGAPSRRMVSHAVEAGGLRARPPTAPRSEKPLCAEPVPTLAVSPCGKIQA